MSARGSPKPTDTEAGGYVMTEGGGKNHSFNVPDFYSLHYSLWHLFIINFRWWRLIHWTSVDVLGISFGFPDISLFSFGLCQSSCRVWKSSYLSIGKSTKGRSERTWYLLHRSLHRYLSKGWPENCYLWCPSSRNTDQRLCHSHSWCCRLLQDRKCDNSHY